MVKKNYYIEKILTEKKITTFLEERGISPVRTYDKKIMYRCPVHSGDNDPSFIVYPAGTGKLNLPYQTYYCFGCHSGLNIINLKRDIDKISTKEAIRYFLKDINVDKKEVMDEIIDSIQSGEISIEDDHKKEKLLLMINRVCRSHLLVCNDEEEILFFEKVFEKIDDIARSNDLDTLSSVHEILIGSGLSNRVDKFHKRKEEENRICFEWNI